MLKIDCMRIECSVSLLPPTPFLDCDIMAPLRNSPRKSGFSQRLVWEVQTVVSKRCAWQEVVFGKVNRTNTFHCLQRLKAQRSLFISISKPTWWLLIHLTLLILQSQIYWRLFPSGILNLFEFLDLFENPVDDKFMCLFFRRSVILPLLPPSVLSCSIVGLSN